MILDNPGMSGGLRGKNKAVWRILGSL